MRSTVKAMNERNSNEHLPPNFCYFRNVIQRLQVVCPRPLLVLLHINMLYIYYQKIYKLKQLRQSAAGTVGFNSGVNLVFL